MEHLHEDAVRDNQDIQPLAFFEDEPTEFLCSLLHILNHGCGDPAVLVMLLRSQILNAHGICLLMR